MNESPLTDARKIRAVEKTIGALRSLHGDRFKQGDMVAADVCGIVVKVFPFVTTRSACTYLSTPNWSLTASYRFGGLDEITFGGDWNRFAQDASVIVLAA